MSELLRLELWVKGRPRAWRLRDGEGQNLAFRSYTFQLKKSAACIAELSS